LKKYINQKNLVIPEVIAYKIIKNIEILLIEWIDMHNFDQKKLGKGLGELHLKSAESNPKMFGYPVEGFIGTTDQKKGLEDNWIDCFLNLRLVPQLLILKSTILDKEIINKEKLTKPHYAKISFRHANPVGYTNQTYLYDLKEYLTLDVGIHLFDLSRFFMGEAKSIYTVNQNTNNKFKGETDFISLIRNRNNSITIVDASISSIKKPDRFAQTLVNLEFSNGSIDLDYNYKITLHKNNKKKIYDGKPKKYKWISKPWDQIQESVINTHKHFIDSLINNIEHDTSGEDNIKSLSLVFNSYKSDKLRKEIKI